MQSRTLSKSDIQDIDKTLQEEYNQSLLSPKDNIRLIEEEHNIITIDGTPAFFKKGNQYIPTIKYLLQNNFLKTITVDMGAVKHVVNGADIMLPGIVQVDNIYQDDIIAIIDVDNEKPIAVGKALMNKQDCMDKDKGRAAQNIHYVGDEIWNTY